MLHPSDRRDVAVLGLVVLSWALVLSPLLHTVEHAHGHEHHHGPVDAPQGRHGDGAVEHLGLIALEGSSLPLPPLEHLARELPSGPRGVRLAVEPLALEEVPQGP